MHILFLLAVFICSLAVAQDSLVRIQPGQGSINITYHGDLAVIYDAGVSSQQMHTKLQSLAQSDPTTIITPKRRSAEFEELNLSSVLLKQSATPQKSSNTEKIATTQKETYSVNSPQKFKKALEGMNTIIFFGSHSDKDHWNLLTHIDMNVSVLCFFNDMRGFEEKDSSELSDFLKRSNIYCVDTKQLNSVINVSFPVFFNKHLEKIKSPIIKKVSDHLHLLSGIYLWNLNPKSTSSNGKSYIISESFNEIGLTMFFTGDAEDETFSSMPNDIRGILSENYGLKKDDTIAVVMPHHGSKHHSEFIEKLCPSLFIVSSGNGAQYPHPHMDLIHKIDQLKADDFKNHVRNYWKKNYLTHNPSGCFYFNTVDETKLIKRVAQMAIEMNVLPPKRQRDKKNNLARSMGKRSTKRTLDHSNKKRYYIKPNLVSQQYFRKNTYEGPVILGTNFGGELFFQKNGDVAQECNFCISAFGKKYAIDIAKRACVQKSQLKTTDIEEIKLDESTQLYYYQVFSGDSPLYYLMEEIKTPDATIDGYISSDETASLTDDASEDSDISNTDDDSDSPLERRLF